LRGDAIRVLRVAVGFSPNERVGLLAAFLVLVVFGDFSAMILLRISYLSERINKTYA
jgi:hypothetical protein